MQLLWGFLIALVISAIAWRLRLLSLSGAGAAVLLGTVVFGLGGLEWSILLVAFFASSSGLTRLFAGRKKHLAATFSKGGRRDAGQVLANGGLAGAIVLAHAIWPNWTWSWAVFAGILAAVNADTWATELGVLSPHDPRLITTLRPVEPGASGGVSWVGTLAALAGSLTMGLLAILFRPAGMETLPGAGLVLGAALGGLAGSLVDSLLGATLQAIYYCPACAKETERHPIHTCGAPTTRIRGVSWLGNDGVNLLCGLTGGLLALLFAFI